MRCLRYDHINGRLVFISHCLNLRKLDYNFDNIDRNRIDHNIIRFGHVTMQTRRTKSRLQSINGVHCSQCAAWMAQSRDPFSAHLDLRPDCYLSSHVRMGQLRS